MEKNTQPTTKKANALHKVSVARSNLLLMIGLTAINIILCVAGTNTMMLFSATIPYFISAVAILSEITPIIVIGIVISVIILLLYLVCWIFSKKHYGFMIATLVFFIIDSIAMVIMYLSSADFSGILDVAVHIWVLYYLIIGVKYGHQLKHLTPEEEAEYENAQNLTSNPEIMTVAENDETNFTEMTDTNPDQ